MGSIDEMLPIGFIFCVQIGLRLISVITVISIVNYLLLVPTVFIAILFYYLRAFYLVTSRSIKRLEGVTRSPVFSHLNASIQGLTTIRAFKAQSILEKKFDNHQEFDHPHILLKNKEGFLYRMVEQTGKATAETLLNVAAANYKPYIDDPEVSS
ncbi:putative multidrug resistance-associated protein lethal(2)03659 isoform X2 [Lycorma delicatula]|uniref:putative multidrug resistance-associated protein lethal(2)03659 isoform X2 n=1 Tax=Lycorma delicatula TaxID=130591 RepID=UPI003F510E48